MFEKLTVLSGMDKYKKAEKINQISVSRGEVLSIVGYTGSGKSQLIQDIESLSQGDSVSKRRILLDDCEPDEALMDTLNNNMVAHLSQNMQYMLDMTVGEFIHMHSRCLGKESLEGVGHIINCANELAGELISKEDQLVKLSGGQTRSLMIANIVVLSAAPIVLIDEIENAGIDKLKAMNMLIGKSKIVLVVTHDPLLALSAKRRLIMKNGGMNKMVNRTENEVQVKERVHEMNRYIARVQDNLRLGVEVEI